MKPQLLLTLTGLLALADVAGAQGAFTRQAVLPGPVGNAPYGRAVAVSGDTMVTDIRDGSGAEGACVFVRTGTNWTQQAILKAHNRETNISDLFGWAVAISGDTVVVGARFEDSNATGVNGEGFNNQAPDAGAAYVFVRTGTNWSQQAYLKAPISQSLLSFGNSVAVWGDTVAVAPVGSNDRGVYIFQRSGTNWTYQTTLLPLQGNLGYGTWPLALSADTLVVGVPHEANNATGVNGAPTGSSISDSGAAFVFVRNGTNWSQQAYLKASNTDTNDRFGRSVALSGDTLVVGAPNESSDSAASDNNNLPDSGAAYVFVRAGTNWSQQQFLKAPSPRQSAKFGSYAALSGDRLVVAEFRQSLVHVFTRAGNSWVAGTGVPALFFIGPGPWLDNIFSIPLALSGGTLVLGEEEAPVKQVEIYDGTAPRIVVEQPAGLSLAAGGSRDLAVLDGQISSLTFTLRNTGDADLTGLAITVDGPDAAMFTVASSTTAPVAPGGSTSFVLRFEPASATPKTAALHLASNDADRGTLDLNLRGYTLFSTNDTDGDGLNDVAEFQLSTLGFDWQVSQPNQVGALFGGANKSGLYTAAQVQALNAGTPLLSQVAPGQFKLTLGVQKATHLTNFTTFPMSAPQTTINGQGNLEFRFTAPDNAAFYRLESR